MRKFGILLLIMLLMFTVSVSMAQDNTSLAQYFPEDTVAYASVRVDPGAFETIDGFLAAINRNTGGMLPPELSVQTLLSLATAQMGVSFDRDIQPWLGGSMAIGVTDVMAAMESGEPGILVVAEIKDKGLATDFFSQMMGGMEPATLDGNALFNMGTVALLITDEVILATNEDVGAALDMETSLADSADFSALMDAMPEPDYYVSGYVNLASIVDAMRPMLEAQADLPPEFMESYMNAMSQSGSFGLGLTLKERSLVLDMFAVSEPMPGMPMVEAQPIDPAFASNIPYPAMLTVQGTGFGTNILTMFDVLDQIGPTLQAQLVPMMLLGVETMQMNVMGAGSEAPIPEDAFARYAGIPQGKTDEGFAVLGNPDAPVRMVEYASYACPHCGSYHERSGETFIDLVREGVISVTVVLLPNVGNISDGHMAARAAICAGEQGRFFEMNDTLYSWQETFGQDAFWYDRVVNAAERLHLDRWEFENCLYSPLTYDVIDAAAASATDAGVTGTPTIFINDEKINGADVSTIVDVINGELAASGEEPTPLDTSSAEVMMPKEPAMNPAAIGEDIVMQALNDLDLSVIKMGGILKNGITPWVAGLTGLNLEDDILSWMSGDYAFAVSVFPSENIFGFTGDVLFVTEATDPEKSAYVVERLTEVAGLYGIPHETVTIGDAQALVYPELIPSLLPDYIRETFMETGDLSVVVAQNGELHAVGTQSGVNFAMGGGDMSLADNPAYMFAQKNLLLPDAIAVIYISTESLVDIAANSDNYELAEAEFYLSQIESVTISTNSVDATTGGIRLTVTIPSGVE